MTRRTLLTAIAAAALYAVVLVTSASAALHRVQVTLVTGQTLTMTVDVPPGTPVEQVQIPGLPAAVQEIVDLGPAQTPTPTPTASPVKTPDKPTCPRRGDPRRTEGRRRKQRQRELRRRRRQHGCRRRLHARAAVRRRRTPSTAPRATSTRASGAPRTRSASPSTTHARREPRRLADARRTRPSRSPSRARRRIGVPNFFIDKFRIPPFLLPIYQAAGIQYGVRWEILAAINEIETDYGRNLNVSSAGAVGWMQFLPSTWRVYGVDANNDNVRDPYNPVDAIFAAARYLRAAGADTDIRKAVFAYNHANWYVDSVLLRAQVIGGLPSNLVGSLTGLTQGRFPVNAKATYAGELHKQGKRVREGNAAYLVESTGRRGIRIFSRSRAPVVAVNDGRIVRRGVNERLGRYVMLQDVYGNTYTYAHLGKVVRRYPAPKPQPVTQEEIQKELELPKRDAAPSQAASATDRPARRAPKRKLAERAAPEPERTKPKVTKQRLFANPARPNAADAGGAQQEFERTGAIDGETFEGYFSRVFGIGRKDIQLKRLRVGSRIVAGTILGRLEEKTGRRAPHLLFEVRPAGRGAPRIDPKPILDGWKLLESTAIYRAAGKNPFFGRDAANPSIGQILLMSKEALVRRVLANPRIDAYDCGRHDILSRPDRPARARHAGVPRRLRPAPDRHLAQVRPRLLHGVRQRVPPLVRQRGRHRRDQRDHDLAVDPGRRLDHRADDPAIADAPGHDETGPDHLADGVRGHRQHVRDGRPPRPHPRRLPPALRHQLEDGQAGQRDPQAQAVDQADRSARRDRQPDRAPQAVEVRDAHEAHRLARP